jgi:L-gulonate 3-dehydrogenase
MPLDRTDEPWSESLIARLELERRSVLPPEELAARAAWRDRKLMTFASLKQKRV